MLSQAFIRPDTPMGATLVEGGTTFRVWAPRATSVHIAGAFAGGAISGTEADSLLLRQDDGTWTGFVAGARDGDVYRFLVDGADGKTTKRDPYARELATDAFFPNCGCVIRPATDYPWHDAGFLPPAYSDMVVYQLHVGVYLGKVGTYSTLLDVAGKVDYLAALGINVLQPMPIDEAETHETLGYNGADYFSPDIPFMVADQTELATHLARINALFAAKGLAPLAPRDIEGGYRQVKVLVDLCHAYGIAVVFDVVYNHAGGFDGDDHGLYFWDRAAPGNNNDSLYFTDKGWAGGLSFALWNRDVRRFVIDNALYYVNEWHADGFRYDEISALVSLNGETGWSFCRDLTSTIRFMKPQAVQNAEFWPVNGDIVRASGAGFDITQHDGLREALRNAIGQAAGGASAAVDLDAVARNLMPYAMDQAWQALTCIENHDIARLERGQRIAAIADGSNARSPYARGRSRFASGVLLTAPGIPMIFMGQEFLEYKQWSEDPGKPNLLDWAGLEAGTKPMVDHLRFTQDLIRLRLRLDALRGPNLRVTLFDPGARVLVFHRWLEGRGEDVIVVCSLGEQAHFDYAIGVPHRGKWAEAFNSDVYDDWVNPRVVGNGGAIEATGGPMHGFEASASIAIPAYGILVFTRA